MHQRGGLQSLVGRFVRHARRSQLAQLLIDQRKQFIGGLGVALFDGLKNAGNVAQRATVSDSPALRQKMSSCAATHNFTPANPLFMAFVLDELEDNAGVITRAARPRMLEFSLELVSF